MKYGFVGLGNLGARLALNLLRGGSRSRSTICRQKNAGIGRGRC